MIKKMIKLKTSKKVYNSCKVSYFLILLAFSLVFFFNLENLNLQTLYIKKISQKFSSQNYLETIAYNYYWVRNSTTIQIIIISQHNTKFTERKTKFCFESQMIQKRIIRLFTISSKIIASNTPFKYKNSKKKTKS